MRNINVHILHSVPISNLNRDDSGSPKTAMMGGVLRSRLSSQSQKRAARVNFESEHPSERTFRSKFFPSYANECMDAVIQEQSLQINSDLRDAFIMELHKEINTLVAKDVKAKKNSKKADGTTEDDFDTTATLIHLAESELNSLVYRVLTRNGVTAALERKESHSLVIAAMGRMMANAPKLTMEAAIQVAHAITTHEAIKDMDYFTAVDDLNTENSGAGHLDINEFTSGVFYRHFSIDVDQLKRNWLDFSSDDAPERLRAMLSAMILSLPTGKIASTAAHTIPALIIVEQTTQGLSMATAFDAPVKARGDGYIVPSIIKLEEFRGHARLVTPSLFGAEATFNSIPGSKSITFDELLDIAVSWMR